MPIITFTLVDTVGLWPIGDRVFTLHSNNCLLISDFRNQRVRRVFLTTATVTTTSAAVNNAVTPPPPGSSAAAGLNTGSGCVGGEDSDSGVAVTCDPLTARLRFPRGMALDTADDIFLIDSGNHMIRRISGLNKVTGFYQTFTTILGTGRSGSPLSRSYLPYSGRFLLDLHDVPFTTPAPGSSSTWEDVSAGSSSTSPSNATAGSGTASKSLPVDSVAKIALDADDNLFLLDAVGNFLWTPKAKSTPYVRKGSFGRLLAQWNNHFQAAFLSRKSTASISNATSSSENSTNTTSSLDQEASAMAAFMLYLDGIIVPGQNEGLVPKVLPLDAEGNSVPSSAAGATIDEYPTTYLVASRLSVDPAAGTRGDPAERTSSEIARSETSSTGGAHPTTFCLDGTTRSAILIGKEGVTQLKNLPSTNPDRIVVPEPQKKPLYRQYDNAAPIDALLSYPVSILVRKSDVVSVLLPNLAERLSPSTGLPTAVYVDTETQINGVVDNVVAYAAMATANFSLPSFFAASGDKTTQTVQGLPPSGFLLRGSRIVGALAQQEVGPSCPCLCPSEVLNYARQQTQKTAETTDIVSSDYNTSANNDTKMAVHCYQGTGEKAACPDRKGVDMVGGGTIFAGATSSDTLLTDCKLTELDAVFSSKAELEAFVLANSTAEVVAIMVEAVNGIHADNAMAASDCEDLCDDDVNCGGFVAAANTPIEYARGTVVSSCLLLQTALMPYFVYLYQTRIGTTTPSTASIQTADADFDAALFGFPQLARPPLSGGAVSAADGSPAGKAFFDLQSARLDADQVLMSSSDTTTSLFRKFCGTDSAAGCDLDLTACQRLCHASALCRGVAFPTCVLLGGEVDAAVGSGTVFTPALSLNADLFPLTTFVKPDISRRVFGVTAAQGTGEVFPPYVTGLEMKSSTLPLFTAHADSALQNPTSCVVNATGDLRPTKEDH
eukprot:g13593.t1